MRLKIAARRSDLARLQAYRVGEALRSAHPQLEIEYFFKESLGDKNLHDPLWKMPERGVFTEDFRDDLLNERVDLVVHSWKDLPIETRAGSSIVATMKRADPRDLLLLKKSSVAKKPRELKIFSSSPRRAYTLPPFLHEYLPFAVEEIEFQSVRGNIPTRLRKYREEQAIDGLVVAKAALDRLLTAEEIEFAEAQKEIREALAQSKWMVLPLEAHPTAAAQGALAIEIKNSRSDLAKLLEAIQCKNTFSSVQKERKILAEYGGGCHQKIGISVLPLGDLGELTYLRGETEAGQRLDKMEFTAKDQAPLFQAHEKWPEHPEQDFFERRPLPNIKNPEANALYIAKAEALPAAWHLKPETIVWASGLKTWKKLAKRGIWVNGSSESRGEQTPEIQALAPEAKFLKLSHSGAPNKESLPLLATYELISKNPNLDLQNKEFFYWTSGSSFDEAVKHYPSVLEKQHASGLGNTYEHLREKLPKHKKIFVFLSYKDWQEYVKP